MPPDISPSETPRSERSGLLGSITLPRRAAEVAAARRFVAATLGGHPTTETAQLLTSEAVTNAVIHTGGATVTVTVLRTAAGVRLEVTDGGADTVPTVHDAGDLREDGRGVFLLRHLSARCGFRSGEGGLTFWFEL
ncbi:ATP-binding protein [Actinomadura sp. DC4]|uniref:ATP-binding protein n=1 Tax=Actinomadura sp. DC4 TaxID=3055069 RepID=UPI0025AFF48C|nr:ATP-binding protein [Actinomadura sp. DC4]MDN3357419.1 ATP-binding protein [Actinomadura sp. DC4]